MAEDSDLERTEPASARRLEQAREEGQVPRSREIGAFLVLMVAAASFWFVGPWMMQRAANIVRRGLTLDESVVRDTAKMTARFSELAFDALLAFSPLIGALEMMQSRLRNISLAIREVAFDIESRTTAMPQGPARELLVDDVDRLRAAIDRLQIDRQAASQRQS